MNRKKSLRGTFRFGEGTFCSEMPEHFVLRIINDSWDEVSERKYFTVSDVSTSIEAPQSDMRMYSENGVLYISSDKECDVDVYCANGEKKARLHVNSGLNSYDNLGKGFYIVNGRKMIIG